MTIMFSRPMGTDALLLELSEAITSIRDQRGERAANELVEIALWDVISSVRNKHGEQIGIRLARIALGVLVSNTKKEVAHVTQNDERSAATAAQASV